jgi:hypothetical protein
MSSILRQQAMELRKAAADRLTNPFHVSLMLETADALEAEADLSEHEPTRPLLAGDSIGSR